MKAACLLIAIIASAATMHAMAQEVETPEQKLQRLSATVQQVQSQMSAYQQQLLELQKQIAELQAQMGSKSPTQPPASIDQTAASLDEIRERQAIAESQIATHEQSKVETESKYGLKLDGLILLNGFVNTGHVDNVADPTYATPGSGSTGFSVRQTILGFDAHGPHLMGAASHADLHVDFFANGSQQTYGASGILRMRTAHASLQWKNTQAFFAFDRPIIAPNMPTSLVSTAQPNLAWSGDLWTWNPQVGVSHDFVMASNKRLRIQGALIDAQDPMLPNTTSTATVTRAERSRWPGFNGRIAYAASDATDAAQVGVGGYVSPHRTADGYRFTSWAITGDLRLPIGRHFELTSNVYRGAGLGGLGAGGYVDYVYPANDPDSALALNDAGGWIQAKARSNERLQFNAGFGIDNPFAADIRASTPTLTYSGIARNRAAFGNVIYSPSRYLIFSVEYRKLWTNLPKQSLSTSDVIGVGAGYRF